MEAPVEETTQEEPPVLEAPVTEIIREAIPIVVFSVDENPQEDPINKKVAFLETSKREPVKKDPIIGEDQNKGNTVEVLAVEKVPLKEPSSRKELKTETKVKHNIPRGKAKQKVILRSRTKTERKRFTGSLKRNRGEGVKLAPTYKILPKREYREESITFKTKNPRARAKIKKVMERWEPK